MFKFNTKKNSGVAILFVILIIGVLISIVTVLSGIFAIKIKLSLETKYSVNAIYAAESGVEYCLYKRKDISYLGVLTLDNGATVTTTNCESGDLKSIGKYRGVSRAIEITF